MNHEKLTTVEIRVNRNRRIRLLVILAIVAWILVRISGGEFVLADNQILFDDKLFMSNHGQAVSQGTGVVNRS